MLSRFFIYLGVFRQERSLADFILNKRSTVSLAIAVSAFAVALTGLSYFMWIHPVFVDPDFSNMAVSEYVSSDFYKAESHAAGERLKLYNDGIITQKPPNLTFVYPFQGVLIKHELSLTPTSDARLGGGHMYKFENAFKVSLNVAHLLLFCVFLSIILMIGIYAFLNRPPEALVRLEELVLSNHFSVEGKAPPFTEMLDIEDRLNSIFNRFHSFVLDLNNRPRGAPPFEVKDEYDVQDLMLPILRMEFGKVKREVAGPDIAGGATRVDFQLIEEGVLIEVKKTRNSMNDRNLSEQMIVDIARYSAHEHINLIVFFIYDPESRIRNPLVLLQEIERQRRAVEVKVFISPRWFS